MKTYYKLPLSTLEEMAKEKGLKIDYHPIKSVITTTEGEFVATAVTREGINKVISEYNKSI